MFWSRLSVPGHQEHHAGQRDAEQDASDYAHDYDVKEVLNYPIPRAIHR